MRFVYRGVTGAPLFCVKFYGVTVLKQGPAQGLFLAFELAREGSIDEYLDKHAKLLQWEHIREIFSGIATGLSELHARGIAHGSIPFGRGN
jgi:serine/threonine protein kinase